MSARLLMRQHGSGFQLTWSHRNTFVSNRVANSRRGFWFEGSDKNVLRANTATNVPGEAFLIIDSKGNKVIGNEASDTNNGFFAHTGSARNTFTDNTSSRARGMGMQDVTTGGSGDAGTDNFYAAA